MKTKFVFAMLFICILIIMNCAESPNENNELEKHIKLLKPNGGETFFIGDTINVTWENENVNDFDLYISIDNGISWTLIVEKLINISEYNFVYNDTTRSDNCIIKIEDNSDINVFDISDSVFNIVEDTVKQIKPEIRIISEGYSLYSNKSPLFFSYDSKYLISWGNSSTNIWDVKTGKLYKSHPMIFFSASPTQSLIVGTDGYPAHSLSVWDFELEKEVFSMSCYSPEDIKLSHNGKYLALAYGYTIEVWNIAENKRLYNITLGENPSEDVFHTVNFSPDDKIIASGHSKLRFYSLSNGEKINEINRGGVFSIKFSNDGKQLIAGGVNGTVNIWDIDAGEKTLEFNVDSERVYSIDLSPNGEKLLIGTKGELLFWDLINNSQDKVIYNSGILGVAYSNDSKYIAGKGSNKIIIYGPLQ